MARRADYEPHTGDPEQDLAYEREKRRALTEDEVPTEVHDFLTYFARMIDEENVPEIYSLYDQAFPELTEK